jgi:GNAT superfamily N-acetyltransferase
MRIPDGYHDIPTGKLATVVTYLEMTAPPPPRPERSAVPWSLRHVTAPTLDWYRDLYRRVGEDWLWCSRLELADVALAAIITAPDVEVHALVVDGRDEGILELDFRVAGECEIGFFGLAPSIVGAGAGRWLMNRAIARAWARPIRRFWLHTCSLDSPAALDFYRRSGFVPYDRKVEVFDDPRLTGVLPRSAAPQIPMIAPRG